MSVHVTFSSSQIGDLSFNGIVLNFKNKLLDVEQIESISKCSLGIQPSKWYKYETGLITYKSALLGQNEVILWFLEDLSNIVVCNIYTGNFGK